MVGYILGWLIICLPVAVGGGGKGGHAPRATLARGWHFKSDKNFRPVYSYIKCFTALICVHQRCSVTFEMHQIHLRPGAGALPTHTLGAPHTP